MRVNVLAEKGTAMNLCGKQWLDDNCMAWVMDLIAHRTKMRCRVVSLYMTSLPSDTDSTIALIQSSRVLEDMENCVISIAVNCGRYH